LTQLNISQELTLTSPDRAQYARDAGRLPRPRQNPAFDAAWRPSGTGPAKFVAGSRLVDHVEIILNGERVELEGRMSVSELLSRLSIDPRRVAVEHNLSIIRRPTFGDVIVNDGDTVEIVNFVGGG
jgi:thiamine biosynthesis protein ThiS